jgi:hypothetical protein
MDLFEHQNAVVEVEGKKKKKKRGCGEWVMKAVWPRFLGTYPACFCFAVCFYLFLFLLSFLLFSSSFCLHASSSGPSRTSEDETGENARMLRMMEREQWSRTVGMEHSQHTLLSLETEGTRVRTVVRRGNSSSNSLQGGMPAATDARPAVTAPSPMKPRHPPACPSSLFFFFFERGER